MLESNKKWSALVKDEQGGRTKEIERMRRAQRQSLEGKAFSKCFVCIKDLEHRLNLKRK